MSPTMHTKIVVTGVLIVWHDRLRIVVNHVTRGTLHVLLNRSVCLKHLTARIRECIFNQRVNILKVENLCLCRLVIIGY